MNRIVYLVGRVWFWLQDNAAALIYNLSLLFGIAAIAIGVGMQFGRGWAFIAAGVLVLVFTLYGAERLQRRRA